MPRRSPPRSPRFDSCAPLARILATSLAVSVACAACADTKPHPVSVATAPSAPPPAVDASTSSTPPPDDPLPSLRTGAIAPIEVGGVFELRVTGRYVEGGYEILTAAPVPTPDAETSPATEVYRDVPQVAVDSPAGAPQALGFLDESRTPAILCVRRALPARGAPADVTGDLFASPKKDSARTPGRHARFHVATTPAAPTSAPSTTHTPSAPANGTDTYVAWMRAFARSIGGWSRHSPWTAFASARIDALANARDPRLHKAKTSAPVRAAPRVPVQPPTSDLSELMGTTTGTTAIQEALQHDRPLFLRAMQEKPSIAVDSLKKPPLARHPWPAMLARLPAGPTTSEPMAAITPADFYFARASDLTSLLLLLDQVDAWGTPAANVVNEVAEDHDLAARYETQLGLRRTALTRALGPAVIGPVAITGSDPYWKEGSDVTVVLSVKDRTVVDAALAATLADVANGHGSLAQETRKRGDVTVGVARSSDGAVTQQRASIKGPNGADWEIVSNSPGAMDAVIDASQGKRPRLADEADFRFMLARDAGVHADVLAYMGDRFVEQVVGPKQKVLEARRQIALGELMTPGFAALLYGRLQGHGPSTAAEIVGASLLGKDELTHASGAPIAWQPGSAARSSWGTPAAMTPLIDLPAPDQVTPSERASYESFARAYEYRWSAYIDPVAIRIGIGSAPRGSAKAGTSPGEPASSPKTMTVEVRELPLIDGTQYRDFLELTQKARFVARPAGDGARFVVGIGADTSLRRELSSGVRAFSSHDLKLDWIGDWAAIGVVDRSYLASALMTLDEDDVPQLPVARSDSDSRGGWEDMIAVASKMPAYAEIAIKGAAQAALALAGVRVIAQETIPGMFEWGESERHRDIPIVRVTLKKEVAFGAGELAIYYAVVNGALVLSLKDWVIRGVIDQRLDGAGPEAAPSTSADANQVAFELGSEPGKGIWTALAWLLEDQLIDAHGGLDVADAILRGAPETAGDPAKARALAFAYFGSAPLTPDGASYVAAKEGVRDPARGSSFAPIWPDVPVPGSPVERVLRAIRGVRTELSFDDEGRDGDKPMQSLHARATFDLR